LGGGMGLNPIGHIRMTSDWRGTAEELAAEATAYLGECGFDETFACTERLVRYYLTRGVLSPPEKDPVDRRKALFGPVQFRQLVLTRLLAERGWDLDRVIGQLHGMKGPRSVNELDALLNQLAAPTEAERLLFKSRAEEGVSVQANRSPMYDRRTKPGLSLGESVEESVSRSPKQSLIRRMLMSARSEEGGLERLSLMAEKLLREPSVSEAESAALKELAEMARLAFRQPGKRERWTRVKLAPWCEVNLRVGKDSELSEEQKLHIIKEFNRLIEDYDSKMGL
jgi:hypothetical protein